MKTKVEDLKHRALIGECWAGHEGFRKLGFTPDQIKVYCGTIGDQKELYLCATVGEAEKLFLYVAGPVTDATPAEIYEEWNKFVTDVLPEISERELEKFYLNSYVGTPQKLETMITGLIIKGIPIPNFPVSEEDRQQILKGLPS
jgi:hypothetical protein